VRPGDGRPQRRMAADVIDEPGGSVDVA
jgi:hypothetical protein